MSGRKFITNEKKGVSIELTRLKSDNYEIRETITSAENVDLFVRATFTIIAFQTMLRNIVIVSNKGESPIQMEFTDEKDVHRLFNISVRHTLHEHVTLSIRK